MEGVGQEHQGCTDGEDREEDEGLGVGVPDGWGSRTGGGRQRYKQGGSSAGLQ